MFKKLFCILLIMNLFIGNKVYADELTPPEQPVIENMSSDEANELINEYNSEVDSYNQQVDEYNQKVDDDYNAAIIDYNNQKQEVEDHNAEEDRKVGEVETHNSEEDAKVEKSQQELEIIEGKVEANAPGTSVSNFTTNSDELPTDWSDETEDLKTIEIEEAEEKSGETAKIINLHLYLDSTEVPGEIFEGGSNLTNDNFTITQDIKDSLIFAEWEVATFDLNDTVTTRSEGIVYKDERIRHEGKNYKVQDYDARFIRNVEDYTQGAWNAGGSAIASNANTLEYGWGYDFDTQTGKGGETYISQFTPEERTQYYLDNGELKEETVEVRTVDKTEPKNILSIFVYLFQRFWDEPTEYEPQYEEYTPDYMEMPDEPVKGEYKEKLNHMDNVPDDPKSPVIPSDPTPVDPDPEPDTPRPIPVDPKPEPIIEEVEEPVEIVEEEVVIIEPEEVPQALPEGSWALFNLICAILTALSTILTIIFFKRKVEEDEEEDKIIKNSYMTILASVVLTIGSIWLFLITEDMRLPMVIFDKYSPIMFILLLIGICDIFIRARKEEDRQEK